MHYLVKLNSQFLNLNSWFLKLKPWLRWWLTGVVLIGIVVYAFRLEALAWHAWHNHQPVSAKDTLQLKNYQVAIDARPIPSLKNASGLTYNAERNSLFTVLNQESKIVELDVSGRIVRQIDVTGVDDMEGITHVAGDRYVIADERDNRLILIHLADNATTLDVKHAPKLKLGINAVGNKNFEGVSWDDVNKRLLVVKERDPKYILSVSGFFEADMTQPLNVEIKRIEAFDRAIQWSLRDLSSVTYLDDTGHILLLSDESRLIKEYDEHGKALGALALWKGFHGLRAHVPQAEGIAVGTDKSIYIMSEPNLFYVFKPQMN